MAPRKSASKAAPVDDVAGTYPAWSRPVTEVASKWGVNLATGLSSAVVEARRAVYGFNELKKEACKPLWKLILEQFDDPLVKARAAPHAQGCPSSSLVLHIAHLRCFAAPCVPGVCTTRTRDVCPPSLAAADVAPLVARARSCWFQPLCRWGSASWRTAARVAR